MVSKGYFAAKYKKFPRGITCCVCSANVSAFFSPISTLMSAASSFGLLIVFLTMSAIEPLSMMLEWAQYLAVQIPNRMKCLKLKYFFSYFLTKIYIT